MTEQFDHDVVVVGAGPAGSTLACLLAQAGHDVLLLEKGDFPRYQIGESLLPATVRDLADMLGVRAKLEASDFYVKRGATFSWGVKPDSLWHLNFGGTRSMSSELAPDVPSAYNVSRGTFDEVLLNNAVEKGVRVKFHCAVQQFLENEGRVTGVGYKDEGGVYREVTARYVADASGQKSRLARHIGKRSLSAFFTKLALWRYFDHGKRMPDPLSGNTLFQSTDGAWVWYIPISDTMTSVGVVAPASAYEKGDTPDDFLARQIDNNSLIKSLLDESKHSDKPPYDTCRICSEYSYMHSSFWRPGALMLGDSACFVDVLLSSGVHLATFSGVLAAQSINAALTGVVTEEVAMNEFETRYRREYAIFFDGLVGLYDTNQDEDTYASWLRKLLIDTSGIAFDSEELLASSIDCGDDEKLVDSSRQNLARMRRYNEAQIDYSGEAGMFQQKIPELSPALRPSTDRRSWVRLV